MVNSDCFRGGEELMERGTNGLSLLERVRGYGGTKGASLTYSGGSAGKKKGAESVRKNSFASVCSDLSDGTSRTEISDSVQGGGRGLTISDGSRFFPTVFGNNPTRRGAENVEADDKGSLYKRIMVSSNFVQFVLKDKHGTPPASRGENRNVSNKAFNIREYCYKEDNLPLELHPREGKPDANNDDNRDIATALAPNIPLLQFISFHRQEQVLNKRLNAIWLGYKTRCVLRGTFGSFQRDLSSRGCEKGKKTSVLNLRYAIHEVLNSIFDLYELIKDEEGKKEGVNSSWLDALYDQTREFKRKYVLEVNKLLFSKGNEWASHILRSKERNVLVVKQVDIASMPSKYERVYAKLMKRGGGSSLRRMPLGNEELRKGNQDSRGLDTSQENWWMKQNLMIPLEVVKTGRLDCVSNYLNVPLELINSLVEHGEILKGKGTETKALSDYHSFEESKNLVYFTPKSNGYQTTDECETVTNSSQVALQDQDTTFCTPRRERNGFETPKGRENTLDGSASVNKPRPYLKRKSKSIVPSKETNVELKGVRSKFMEIYRGGRPLDESGTKGRSQSIKCLGETIVSRIPGVSPNVKLVSDSPSSRNSSAKVSRIPKYNKCLAFTEFKHP